MCVFHNLGWSAAGQCGGNGRRGRRHGGGIAAPAERVNPVFLVHVFRLPRVLALRAVCGPDDEATVRQRLDPQTHCHLGGSIRNRFPRSVCLPSAGCHSGFRNRDQLWRLVHSVAATHIDSGSHFLA